MSTPVHLKAMALAVAASAVGLSSVFATARALRSKAQRVSHQQPADERWFEHAAPSTPELVTRGRVLFLDSCAHCHGADARGDEGPDLHDLQVSDRYIAKIVTRGIPSEMPSFAKKHGTADIRALTAYVRSLE